MLEHEQWLALAELDYKSAKSLFKDDLFSTSTFHCQQAAEKYLKGYLCFKGEQITKTHDLVKSLEQCMKFDKDFQKLYSAIRALNPFATRSRYPSEFDIPDLNDAKLAIKQAESVMNFVMKKISESIVGQMEIR